MSRGNSGEALREWVNVIKQWDFVRVIPAHLDAPLAVGPAEFTETFEFAFKGKNEVSQGSGTGFEHEGWGWTKRAEEVSRAKKGRGWEWSRVVNITG